MNTPETYVIAYHLNKEIKELRRQIKKQEEVVATAELELKILQVKLQALSSAIIEMGETVES